MAEKGWTAQVAAAAGVAAGTGAAQLGLGYGLGVVVWPVVPTADDSVWLGSLGWATWIAANATVFGAVIAGRLGRATGGPWRLALAASAAVGALLTVALIALPARAAVRVDTFSPQTIAGGYAVVGVLLGLVIAYWAVVSRPVAANLIATAAWLWSLAVAAVVVSILWHRPSATYLSSWQFAAPDSIDGLFGTIYWPSALLSLLAALIIGVIGALPAVLRGDLGVGAASSGAVGPLLVAAAFFVLAPQLTGALGPLESAYLIAPYGVLAGLGGSALTVAIGQGRANRRAARPAPRPVGPRAIGSGAAGSPAGAVGSVPAGAGAAAVPAPRSAGRADARAATVPAAPAGRTRPSLLGRLRRSSAARDGADERPGVVTGRAKAPAAPANGTANPAQRSPAPAQEKPAGPPATGRTKRGRAGSGKPGPAPAPPAAPPTPAPATPAPAPSVTKPASPRGKASVTRPAGSARPGAAAVESGARSAAPAAAPGGSDVRSTVAPPPPTPQVVKINPPRSGESPPEAVKRASGVPKPGVKAAPGPADDASSDKTPPAGKTAAKPTKSTPAKSAAPAGPAARKTAAKAEPGGAATNPAPAETADGDKGSPWASPLWVDDTAEPPAEETKRRGLRRFGRRSGEDKGS
ncbi:Hansenula MRAKII killer toxin-resistant protein 1 [Actinoplanes sp. NPDC049118]|uniref:Hansenula MRAKII killer toxin-resistant protein 1 n=1 Tax=Actinoplanes sp. NPDC049118 TaxID=3155769 RepID=UPI0034099DB3